MCISLEVAQFHISLWQPLCYEAKGSDLGMKNTVLEIVVESITVRVERGPETST